MGVTYLLALVLLLVEFDLDLDLYNERYSAVSDTI